MRCPKCNSEDFHKDGDKYRCYDCDFCIDRLVLEGLNRGTEVEE